MRTIDLKSKNHVYWDVYGDDRMAFAAVKGGSIVGNDTACKEEIGCECVKRQAFEMVLVCPDRLDDKEVREVQAELNKHFKKLKVAGVTFARVKDRRKWLYIKYSPRWARNSVAHSYLTTILRKTICTKLEYDHPDFDDGDDFDDGGHLDEARPVVSIIEKHGLGVFGTKVHKSYDVGMVSLSHRLLDGFGKDGQTGTPPYPKEEDFASREDYWDAVDEWEDRHAYHDGYYGDFDREIPADNAYQKLIAIFHGKK